MKTLASASPFGPGWRSLRRALGGNGRPARAGLLVTGALLALMVSAASASAAPFANGSFETPVVPPPFVTEPTGFSFGNWVVSAGTVDIVRSSFWQAADGNQSIDMIGISPGTLCQTYDSASPGNGTVTFSLSHSPFLGVTSATLQVLVNGVPVGSFTHSTPNSPADMKYESHTVSFPVVGPTTQLCFKSILPTGVATGAVLDAVALTASADLSLTKTASPTPDVQHNQNVTYTLTASNAGPNTALAPTIVDVLPAGQTFVAAGSSPGCSASGQTVTCTTADLPASSSVTVTIVARAGTVGAGQTDTASVSSTTFDANPGNNSTSATVNVVPSADLSLTKTSSPNPVIAGQQLTYTLTATNAGPDTAVNAKIVDTLPPGAVFQKEGTGAGSASCTAAGQVVTCLVGDIPAGGTATVMILVLPVSGSAVNNATVSSDTADPNLANNGATNTTTVSPSCTDTRTGVIEGSIDVHAGQFLCLSNATVIGAILVDPGGALTTTNSTIKGAIQGDGAQFMTICGSTINGAGGVIIKNTVLLVRLGDDNSDCAPNHITGSVLVTGNHGGVEVFANTIRGSLSVNDNQGGSPIADGTAEVEGNQVGAALVCHGNVPPPINDGIINTTVGAKLGQCSSL